MSTEKHGKWLYLFDDGLCFFFIVSKLGRRDEGRQRNERFHQVTAFDNFTHCLSRINKTDTLKIGEEMRKRN
jgi:hypothetical protein